ncbi:hypothetical protein D7X32_27125 [Corallococcus carmarthensis]|uniref:HK97 gp10 family phage protein n=1 Tax=Corallococcus carmarthensis TaxID=2316728 RepID=A0A3A8KBL5_9BACT|nr:hypothetical protein D7X32_27125 [Corallococcus carmarthensis]
MPVRVKLDLAPLLKLRQQPQRVLRELDRACYATVRHALDLSQFDVPRGDRGVEYDEHGNEKPTERPLAETGFLDGPEYHMDRRLSVTWVAGYAHHAAGAIHEGVHWDRVTVNPEPHFLKKAFRRSRSIGRKGVKTALEQALKEMFPPK